MWSRGQERSLDSLHQCHQWWVLAMISPLPRATKDTSYQSLTEELKKTNYRQSKRVCFLPWRGFSCIIDTSQNKHTEPVPVTTEDLTTYLTWQPCRVCWCPRTAGTDYSTVLCTVKKRLKGHSSCKRNLLFRRNREELKLLLLSPAVEQNLIPQRWYLRQVW